MRSVLVRMSEEFKLLDEFDAKKKMSETEQQQKEEEEEDSSSSSSSGPSSVSSVSSSVSSHTLTSPRPCPNFVSQASSVGFQLPTMDRSRKELVRVPSEVWQRNWLTKLSLSRNKIAEFDGARLARDIPNLTSLDLSHNWLTSLTLQIEGLKELRLSECPIELLELDCPGLELLLLENCRLSNCDPFSQLPLLTTLSLAGGSFKEIQVPGSLTRLDISHNLLLSSLPKLPDSLVSFGCCDNPLLTELSRLPPLLESCLASRCAFKLVDLSSGSDSLIELDVSWNQLSIFDVCCRSSLRRLNLSHNVSLHSLMSINAGLEELNVDHCGLATLSDLPESLLKLRASCCFSLAQIASLPPRLDFFSCCFCPLLSELPDGLPETLSSLWVAHCPRLSLRISNSLSVLSSLFMSHSPGVEPPSILPASIRTLRAAACPYQLDLSLVCEAEIIDVAHASSGIPPASQWIEECREIEGSLWIPSSESLHLWRGPADRSGGSSTVGDRPSNEDAWGWRETEEHVVMAVLCDGHAGKDAAVLACEALLKSDPKLSLEAAIRSADEWVKHGLSGTARHSGTTVLVARFDKVELTVANVGDARALLVDVKNSKVTRLSTDHKPADEEERIRQSGGWVENGRVNGVLGVSRAVGDFYLRPSVVCYPFVSETITPIENCRLLLGCDGLFDEMPDELAAKLIEGGTCQEAAQRVRDAAVALGSKDNISAIVISL